MSKLGLAIGDGTGEISSTTASVTDAEILGVDTGDRTLTFVADLRRIKVTDCWEGFGKFMSISRSGQRD